LKQKPLVKEIAKERVGILLAAALSEKNPELADRQAMAAKKMALRHRIKLAYEARQLYCKSCKALIIPGRTARVRLGRSDTRAIRITCLRCGHVYRKIISRPQNKDL
jgi:ribonuclease P protein subunit RPR2